MFRKNSDFGAARQPVVMALTLNRQAQKERIIIGPEWEVQKCMEGKNIKTQLVDMERPLAQLVFDWAKESAQDWNEAVIYELKAALQNPSQRGEREKKAMTFLAQKMESNNAVSIFWAKNCLREYEQCKKKSLFTQPADLFESRMMAQTRLSKFNVLKQGEEYALQNLIEKVRQIMRTCSYRHDALLQIWYPWRDCNTEFVVIRESVLAGVMYYLNRLLDWHTCIRVCEICGKHFAADSAHHSLCSDACRKEQNRLNKQAYLRRYSNYRKKGLYGFALSQAVFAALEQAAALKGCDCSSMLQQILEKELNRMITEEIDHGTGKETNLTTTKNYALQYGKSQEQIKQYLHQKDRIAGALKVGRDWVIPQDTKFPESIYRKKQKEEV